jgi:enamine deaminase RidA (YjgF/YER057c/UK114 family)
MANDKKGPIFVGNAGGNRSQVVIAGDTMYVSGVRGEPAPGPGPGNTPGDSPDATARIMQIYNTLKSIAEAQGLTLNDCVKLETAMTNAAYIGPTADLQTLPEFWGTGPYPVRTHEVWLQMSGSDTISEFPDIPNWPARGDIVEVTATFSTEGKRK